MRNLKKFVALIVTIAMIATFAIPAFAAAPADVKGTDYEGAVTRLAALGVINGYPNGNFGPNDSITRSQFAAVVVRALGYEDVAESAKGVTKFSDVAANNWASGYINLAVSLGIIKGNPDGSFAPDAPVLYEQAVTMVVRALGQEAFAEKKGGYPSGYLVQAKVIGFTDDVKGVSGVAATRGIVALLIDNAKAVTIYEQTGFGDSQTYEPTSDPAENFLTRLGMSVRVGGDDVIVTGTPGSTALDADDFKVTGDKTFTAIAGAVELESLLGKKVDVWGSADDEIVLVEVVAGTKVAVKSVDEAVYDDEDGVVGVKVTLADDTEEEYTFADNAAALDTFETAAIDDMIDQLDGLDADEYQVSMVVDGDDLLFADAVIFDLDKVASAYTENKVAEWIKLSGYYIKRDGDDIKKLVIVKDGETVDYKAIEDDDILFVAENMGATEGACDDDILYIKATSKTVEGTLEGAKPSLAEATSIKVEGTWYDVSVFIGDIDASENIGGEITLTLDPAGKAYSIAGATVASSDKFGVIVANSGSTALGDTVYKVKILTSAGDKVVYTVEDNDDTAAVTDLTPVVDDGDLAGYFARYTLDSDGNIDSIDVIDPDLAADDVVDEIIDTSRLEFDDDDLSSDVALFDSDSALKLTDIDDDTAATVVAMFRADDEVDGDIVAMLFADGGYIEATSDASFAYITDFTVTGDGEYTVDVMTKDGAKSYATDSFVPEVGDFVEFTLDGSNNMSVEAEIAAFDDELEVEDVDSSKITIDGENYWYADDAFIVDADDAALTKADMYADMVVTLYLVDGDVVFVIVTDM